ncbi:MAG: hypothetical protein R3Y35_05335 [Clostridia bacterium]
MDFVYAGVWFAIAIILLIKFTKESKLFAFLGGFFIIMGAWWLADALTPNLELLEGTYGLILRIIGAITMVVVLVFYYKNYYKQKDKK